MSDILRNYGRQTFASLAIRNFRLYFIGQGLSRVGTWMQVVGLGWLVLELTGSGTQVGVLLAFRYFPQLIGGPFGGIPGDYFPKRRILFITQSLLALIALALGILVFTETAALWTVYALAFAIGIVQVVDNPARQTFIHEMVGPTHLRNAVALNSTMGNLARAVGPMVAGVLIAGVGIATCFFLNALSFLAFIFLLVFVRVGELHADVMPRRQARRVMDGLRYVLKTPFALHILIVMAIIGTLGYEFQVSLPVLAEHVFAAGASGYAALLSVMGVGSIVGGLYSAGRQKVAAHEFVLAAFLFGTSMCVVAYMPAFYLAVSGMFFVGFFSIILSSVGNTMLQLAAEPEVRARVMSLWTMAIFGSTFIGAPLIGFIADTAGGRWGLAAGGIATVIAALWGAVNLLPRDQWLIIPSIVKIRTEQEKEIGTPKI